MTFETQLTASTLRAHAGYSFPRGEAYFRAGNVESCVMSGDAIHGVVVGSNRYTVRVFLHDGMLASSCTCPMSAGCKHVVALSLAYLERAPTARPEIPDGLLGTRDELAAWAAERGVEHALWFAADQLLPRISGVYVNPHTLFGLALRDTGAWLVIRRYLPHAAIALVRATLDRLGEEAERVAAARSEERPTRPDQRALGPLWTALVDARATIPASPRPRAWRLEQRWSFDPRERRIVWKEREDLMLPGSGRTQVQATIAWADGAVRLGCTCSRQDPRCAHVLAAVDATLDRLADPARTADSATLALELMRPPWSRALAEIALHTAAAEQPAPPIEVWWQFGDELRTPMLTAIVKKQTKRGASTKGARMAAAKLLELYRAQLEPRDRAIAEALAAWSPDERRTGSFPVRAFEAAVGHPRLVNERDNYVEIERAVLGFAAEADGDGLRLCPAIDGLPVDQDMYAEIHASLGSGELVLVENYQPARYLLLEVGDDARRMWATIAKHGAVFPREAHAELLELLGRLGVKLPIAIPERLKGEEVTAEPRTVVRLRLLPDAALELELLVRPAPGAPLYPPGVGPRDVMFAVDGQRAYLRRDLGEEAPRARDHLVRLLRDPAIAEEGPPGCFRIHDGEEALALIQRLDPPQIDGLDAEWLSEQPTVVGTYGPRALRVTVKHDRDWFGIAGDLKVEAGRIELAVLLDAARRQQRFVRVDDRRWIELTELLRERLRAIADQTFSGKKRLELSPGAVPAIAALAEAGAKVDTAPAWQLLADRLATADRMRPRPPANLGTTLRDYQVDGHAWLSRVAAWGGGACLADDMGLGKTVQAIALLLDRAKLGPALVLAPTSVCFNWVDELAKFAPSLRPVIYGQQADRAACLAKLGKKDVLIASYGLLVRDAAKLATVPFGTLVVDEAQALKNPTTRRAKAARMLDAKFRVALSGTPLENHLGELWSLFSVVFPGLLGSWDQFRDRFASPIERVDHKEARAALARVIRPFLLRRTKQEVARELPPRTEVMLPIALSAEEHQLYEDARLAAIAELAKMKGVRDEQRRFQVLAALTRLRLLASHPRLGDPASPVASSKLARLVELLSELRTEGHRALVFSQFTSHLALVRAELERAGFELLYLDGSTPAAQRKDIVGAFQAGKADAFLISLKAGGTGLNLTAADYVIHLDPWWNPAVEDQATDRAHRIGQTRPVTVYRLIARGTIEEKILSMHADKRALVASILEGTDVAARLTTKDLLALLASGPDAPARIPDDDPPAPRPRPHLRLVP